MTRRRSIAATLAGSLIISVMLSVSPVSASACSCDISDVSDDAPTFDVADAVFLATVDAVYPARAGSSGNPEVVILQVSGVYKGDVDEFQGIVTPAEGTSCGLEFLPGSVYLVFASRSGVLDVDDGFYEVNRCSGTRLLSEGDLAVDAAAGPPNDAGPPDFTAINGQLGTVRSSILPEAIILVAVLASVLGLAAFFARRDREPTPAAPEDGQ